MISIGQIPKVANSLKKLLLEVQLLEELILDGLQLLLPGGPLHKLVFKRILFLHFDSGHDRHHVDEAPCLNYVLDLWVAQVYSPPSVHEDEVLYSRDSSDVLLHLGEGELWSYFQSGSSFIDHKIDYRLKWGSIQ